MCMMVSGLPAATKIKSVGTGCERVIAPEDLSDWPVIGYFFSWIAVSSSCWDLRERLATSSMKRTPPEALWMKPGINLSYGGVPRPPLWSGSWRQSPSSAPEWAPVASMNGAFSVVALSMRSFGVVRSILVRMRLFKEMKMMKMPRNIMLAIKEAAANTSP